MVRWRIRGKFYCAGRRSSRAGRSNNKAVAESGIPWQLNCGQNFATASFMGVVYKINKDVARPNSVLN